MRWGALGILVVTLGVALFAWMSGRSSSFSGYSTEQLDALEQRYAQASAQKPPVPLTAPSKEVQRSLERAHDSAEEAAVSLSMLQDERRRRTLLGVSLAVSAMALVGLPLLVLLRRGSRARWSMEEARLTAALGTPESIFASEQARSAKLLGVAPDAPAHVVEAALAAQLAARDPARLTGMSP